MYRKCKMKVNTGRVTAEAETGYSVAPVFVSVLS